MAHYRRELVSAVVGFVLPLLLWSAGPIGLDPMTPPTFLVWPSMILMFVLIGNESYVTAAVWLVISALVNAAVYFVLAMVVVRVRDARRSRHARRHGIRA
jgi:hypothetical protein